MIQVSSSDAFHGKASEDLKDRRKRVKQGSRAAHTLTEEKKKVGVLTAAQSLFFPPLVSKKRKNRGAHQCWQIPPVDTYDLETVFSR